jgi:hypothetical protein
LICHNYYVGKQDDPLTCCHPEGREGSLTGQAQILRFAQDDRTTSIQMKHLREYMWKARNRINLSNEDIAHILFPPLAHLTLCHNTEIALEIVNFHIGKKF